MGVSVHLIDQWRYKVYPFARKSDICVICVIIIYNLLYFWNDFNVDETCLKLLETVQKHFFVQYHSTWKYIFTFHFDKLNTKFIFDKSCIYISLCASIITIAITSTVISIIMKLDPLIRSFRIATKGSPWDFK